MGKIYVLIHEEWDGAECGTTENVIASKDREKLVAHRKKLEHKSFNIRNKINELADERDKLLRTLWDQLRPLVKRRENTERTKELQTMVCEAHKKFYDEKEAYLKSLGVEYYIGDEEYESFRIEELEEL